MRLLVQVIVVVGILTSCDSCGEDLPDIFEGTWTGTSTSSGVSVPVKIVAVKGTYIWYSNNDNEAKGTYTVSGNTVTMTTTHQWDPIVTNTWILESSVRSGIISGNTFAYDNSRITFTR
jgi:hypothetical protein